MMFIKLKLIGVPLLAMLLSSLDGLRPEIPWGSLGSTALLGWYLYYTVSRSQPKQQAHYEKIFEAMEQRHAADRQAWLDSLKEITQAVKRLPCQDPQRD